MKLQLHRCFKGCGPIFCCCLLTHYGLGPVECRCRCHALIERPKGSGKIKLAKVRTGMSY